MARPPLLKACLNGARRPGSHPALPVTPEQVARDAERVAAAGADAVHLHARGPDGLEALDADSCGSVVAAVRSRCPGLPVGLTTGAWIEPDPERRLALIRGWRDADLPDFCSVNFS